MPLPTSLIDRREAQPDRGSGHGLVNTARITGTVASAAWRSVAAAVSGLLLVGGVALVLWAVTPGSGADASGMLRGGAVAFAAAHFLPVRIGGVAVTIHPLLLTMVAVAVIASAAGRARMVRGRTLEALHASVFCVGYAVVVDVVVAVAAPRAAAEPGLLAPLCVAAVGSLLGIAAHRTAWNRWWRRWATPWLRAGVRAAAMAVCLLLAAGAIAVAVGLVTSLPDATAVARLTTSSFGGGLGLALVGLAFLPNAVIAGIGYVSGAGFTLGGGSYSPLLVHTADLPAIPLLTAAPDGAATKASLVVFAAPLAAGLLVGIMACRAADTRRDRLIASALASVVTGCVVAGLAVAAAGGVAGGPWSATGVPPLLAGGLVAGTLLVVSGAWAGVAGLRAVAWAPARDLGSDGGGDEDDDLEAAAPVPDDAPAGDDVPDDAAAGNGDDVPDGANGDDVAAGDGAGAPDAGADRSVGDTAEDGVDEEGSDDPRSAGDPGDQGPAGSEPAGDPFGSTAPETDPSGDDQPFPDEADPEDGLDHEGGDAEPGDERLGDVG